MVSDFGMSQNNQISPPHQKKKKSGGLRNILFCQVKAFFKMLSSTVTIILWKKGHFIIE